jgi:hypothetical protein
MTRQGGETRPRQDIGHPASAHEGELCTDVCFRCRGDKALSDPYLTDTEFDTGGAWNMGHLVSEGRSLDCAPGCNGLGPV